MKSIRPQPIDVLSEESLKRLVDASEERSDLDYKLTLDLSTKHDMVELIKDVAATANTQGGFIILGVNDAFEPVGMARQRLEAIRIEDIHNKVSAYLYPSVDGVRFKVFQIDERWFGAIYIPHTTGVIHVFSKHGDYPTADPKKPGHAFSKGTIYVRHGAKSEIITPHDLDRMLKERDRAQRRFLFTGIRKISTAPLGSQVIIQPKGQLRLTQSPNAPGIRLTKDPSAPAVRGLMDADKFQTVEEELLGALKLWKSSPDTYPSMALLAKAYAQREKLRLDDERLEIVVWGSLHYQMPWAYWCVKLGKGKLEAVACRVVDRDAYPSNREVAKALWLLGSRRARALSHRLAKNSRYQSVRKDASRFLDRWGSAGREAVLATPFGKARFLTGSETRQINLQELRATPREAAETAIALAQALLLSHQSEAKWALKKLDLLLYGGVLVKTRKRVRSEAAHSPA